jgi:hypothetical protein
MKFKLDNASEREKTAAIQQQVPTPTVPGQVPGQKPHVNIIFCIPGREFTANFLQCWTNLVNTLYQNNISYALSNAYSPVVYYARSACLRGHVLKGRQQKPFQGEVTYDYIMWIDSDIVFQPQDFYTLLQKMEQDKSLQLLAGTYLMADGVHTTIVDNWDEEFFSNNGSFSFLTMPEVKAKSDQLDVKAKNGLFEAVYAGFGWLMVRYGVHESFEYPFFKPQFHELKGGEIYDFSSEDASFFLELREKGIKCYIDPNVNVGHEKQVVLR